MCTTVKAPAGQGGSIHPRAPLGRIGHCHCPLGGACCWGYGGHGESCLVNQPSLAFTVTFQGSWPSYVQDDPSKVTQPVRVTVFSPYMFTFRSFLFFPPLPLPLLLMDVGGRTARSCLHQDGASATPRGPLPRSSRVSSAPQPATFPRQLSETVASSKSSL